MKKTLKLIFTLTLALATVLAAAFCFTACKKENPADYKSKVYYADTSLGEGAKTVTVKIEDTEKAVTFTIRTDKSTVGEALLEHGLIDGEEGAYGMYIKSANGTVADYDKDQSYWAFYIGDEYAMSGVDTTEIEEGVLYRLVYTK